MTPKIDVFYPFAKGFFGKTLMTANHVKPGKAATAQKAFDSVSDFNKHFEDLMFKHNRLERHPKTDVMERADSSCKQFLEIFPGSII